jgi:predicted Zn-dependent peptidase
LVVPPVNAATLPNGITLKIVEQRELPLVQIIASFEGGSRLDGSHPGMATFMAGMLDEGAGKRNATELQSELAYLGASLGTGSDWDAFTVSLKVPVRSLAPALDLMADVVMRPVFGADDIRRQRDLRFAGLLQTRDQPNALAGLAFNQVLYSPSHPYHRSATGDSTAIMALDSSSVRTFYSRTIRPERATFIVVGDITLAAARQAIAARFGQWQPGGGAASVPAITAIPVARQHSQVFLVDKPDAAQSVISIGWPGVDRRSPDYAALMVMNTILGGSFTSRLNMNLRETKGYSYGARSGFTFRKAPGPFTASSAVRTNVTDSSLVEFFRELRRIRDTLVSADELARAKAYVELGLPASLESTSQVANQLADLGNYGLSFEALTRFAASVRRITPAEVQRVARRHLMPDQSTIVVVGDVARIKATIEALSLGPITQIPVNEIVK